jgi:hypothetical protein
MWILSWANRSMIRGLLTPKTFSVEFLGRLDDDSAGIEYAVSNTSDEFSKGWFVGWSGGLSKMTLYLNSTNVINHPAQIAEGQWFHVAVSFDDASNEVSMWVNGEKATATWTGNLSLSGGKFKVGGQVKSLSQSQRWWRGALDEVAYWTRPLTDTEVADHYQAFAAAPALGATLAPSETFVYESPWV